MSNASDEQSTEETLDPPGETDGSQSSDDELEALRQAVEEKYDFDNFGPADMAEMTAEEWDAVFDADSWVTGSELLDRVEQDLKSRIATRDVFAVLERVVQDGEETIVAYSDEGYATVYPDGSVEGRGTVLRDVKPTVALCSMDDYTPQIPPEDYELPSPDDVAEQSGELGNLMLQVIAFGQLFAGVGLLAVWLLPGFIARDNIVAPIIGAVFIVIALFLFTVVANARLSDRCRSEQYRNRLRAVQLEGGERPEHLPIETASEQEKTNE